MPSGKTIYVPDNGYSRDADVLRRASSRLALRQIRPLLCDATLSQIVDVKIDVTARNVTGTCNG